MLRSKVTLLFATLGLLVAIPAVALADNIQNDVDSTADGKIVSVQAGQTSDQVGYRISATGGDTGDTTGRDGESCNPVHSGAANVTITGLPSSVSVKDLDGDTLTAPHLTFSACGVYQYVKFNVGSAVAAGDYQIGVADLSGYNESPAAFTLRVTAAPPSDTTAPVLSLPADQTVEATSSSGAAVTYSASANDAVDGSVAVNCSPLSGSTFALGETTVTCSAKDAAGNEATGSFKVTVVDTTKPVISGVPADFSQEATGPSGAAVTYTNPTASDLVDGTVSVLCSPTSGSTFPLGTTTVYCSATDNAGNQATASFKVTVQDTTAPVIASHADVSAIATSSAGAPVTYTSPATTDAVDGNGTATCLPASGSTFAIGTTTVTCNATDAAGNKATPTTFKVKVLYSYSGVLQPINAEGDSIFKAGSTVPVKFNLTGASAGITDAVISLKYSKLSNGVWGDDTEAVTNVTATTGSLFRYSEGQYIYNWSTKGLSDGTYEIKFVLPDGTVQGSVIISLKR